MPQRPRQHRLETESRNAFRRALPSQWLSRPVDADYGIDEQVEIFTEAGSATGRSFVVQLKGTDEPDLRSALGVRLKARTVRYLGEQDLPVLIVLFHAPSETLFARWFHSFDAHYAKADQESITHRLLESDRWTESTPEQLVAGVERFRLLRTQRLQFPIPVEVAFESHVVKGIPTGELRIRLRSLAQEVPDVVRLVRPTEEPAGDPHRLKIRIGSEQTVVNPEEAPSVVFHHSFDYSRADVQQRLPADTWMSFCLWLGYVGEVNAAARVARTFAGRSNVLLDPESLFRILGFFVRSHRVTDALELAETLERNADPELADIAALIQTTAIINAPTLSQTERSYLRDYLRERCRKADEIGDKRSGREAHYGLGNFLRSEGSFEGALVHYCRASVLDPRYWERAYFPRELAGIFFGMGRYENAAHLYEVSLKLEDDELTRGLFADALMFSGRYADALASFDKYVEDADEPVAEYQLKRFLLNSVIRLFGPRQERDPSKAPVLFEGVDSMDEAERARRIALALRLDALNAVAWFNRGVALFAEDRRAESAHAFVMAAISQPGDVEAWSNAFRLYLGDETVTLPFTAVVFEVAYRSNGQRFIDQLERDGRQQPPDFDLDGFLRAVDELVGALPIQAPRPVVRFLGEGADFETLDLGPPLGN